MTANWTKRLYASSAMACTALFAAACGLGHPHRHQEATSKYAGAPVKKIVQLYFSSDAAFAVCTEPLCPVVTKKSLAVIPSGVMNTVIPALVPGNVDADSAGWDGPPDFAFENPVTRTAQRKQIVGFASGSATLTASARSALDKAASFVQEGDRISIAGRTDGTGSRHVNQRLSQARAKAVRTYLQAKLAAKPVDFELTAQGACCFTASNNTAEGRRQNRRVEIVFSALGQVAR